MPYYKAFFVLYTIKLSKMNDKKIKFWDIDSSELVRTLDCPGGFPIVGDLIEIENGEVVVFSNGPSRNTFLFIFVLFKQHFTK